jgi:serine/threonine protein kinase
MYDLSGSSIGKYQIDSRLDSGGMATVYHAFDTRLECEVAIKVIRRELFGEEVIRLLQQRFTREARVLAKLNHPNIVPILDFGEHEGAPYLVMRFMPGGTLRERMGQPFSVLDAAHILLPLAKALEYAHSEGVLHRDVKPANILLSKTGEPVLSDFGIARLMDGSDTNTLTATGIAIGTAEYVSPEQGLGKEVDARADVYSLGIVFFELATGRKPFTAPTPMEIIFKHMTEPLPSPRSINPQISVEAEQIILKASMKNPADRFRSMGEMVIALTGLIEQKTGPWVEPAAGIPALVSAAEEAVTTLTEEFHEPGRKSQSSPRPPSNPGEMTRKKESITDSQRATLGAKISSIHRSAANALEDGDYERIRQWIEKLPGLGPEGKAEAVWLQSQLDAALKKAGQSRPKTSPPVKEMSPAQNVVTRKEASPAEDQTAGQDWEGKPRQAPALADAAGASGFLRRNGRWIGLGVILAALIALGAGLATSWGAVFFPPPTATPTLTATSIPTTTLTASITPTTTLTSTASVTVAALVLPSSTRSPAPFTPSPTLTKTHIWPTLTPKPDSHDRGDPPARPTATSQPPTSEPPTAEPPTSVPPTSAPPTSEPPTSEPPPYPMPRYLGDQ